VRSFGRLPLLWNRAVGAVIGYLMWWSRGKSVQVSLENIARALPDLTPEQQFALTKASVIDTAKTVFESPSIWMQPYERLRSLIIEIENLHLIRGEKTPTKNMLVLVPHLGNWELMGSFLPQYLDITFIYQPSGIHTMDALIREGRAREGLKLAPSNRQGVAKVLQALRAGNSVGILPDQVPERDSGAKAAEFFGQKAWTMTLVHKLIQRTQCTVVMGYVQRVPKGFNIIFAKPDPAIYSDSEIESLNGLNRSVEQCVRSIPEQYQWEYKRFKRTEHL
jgi:KDO2-lipid IV(A) lauroyltransferase